MIVSYGTLNVDFPHKKIDHYRTQGFISPGRSPPKPAHDLVIPKVMFIRGKSGFIFKLFQGFQLSGFKVECHIRRVVWRTVVY